MAEEFEYFSTDFNNWNYNEFVNKPGRERERERERARACRLYQWSLRLMLANSVDARETLLDSFLLRSCVTPKRCVRRNCS
jgi:hypothetical protein